MIERSILTRLLSSELLFWIILNIVRSCNILLWLFYRAKAKMERAKILGINEYTFLRTLGKGAFAEVKLGTKSKLENDDIVRDLDVDNFER